METVPRISRGRIIWKPSDDERRCYTRVLQGHIGMARAVFPEGTPGVMFDALARAPLWRDGLNYFHGTGHGMGSYLNVHEGPFGVGGGAVTADKQFASHAAKLRYLNEIRRGHYVSDEPGFYQDGSFGFRIESDLVAVVAETKYAYGTRAWLKFGVPDALALFSVLDGPFSVTGRMKYSLDRRLPFSMLGDGGAAVDFQNLDDAADAARARPGSGARPPAAGRRRRARRCLRPSIHRSATASWTSGARAVVVVVVLSVIYMRWQYHLDSHARPPRSHFFVILPR